MSIQDDMKAGFLLALMKPVSISAVFISSISQFIALASLCRDRDSKFSGNKSYENSKGSAVSSPRPHSVHMGDGAIPIL